MDVPPTRLSLSCPWSSPIPWGPGLGAGGVGGWPSGLAACTAPRGCPSCALHPSPQPDGGKYPENGHIHSAKPPLLSSGGEAAGAESPPRRPVASPPPVPAAAGTPRSKHREPASPGGHRYLRFAECVAAVTAEGAGGGALECPPAGPWPPALTQSLLRSAHAGCPASRGSEASSGQL